MSREETETGLRPSSSDQVYVTIPTPHGTLRVCAVDAHGQVLLVATTSEIPDLPVVRFQSSCVFGESFHAIDCDCGAQLDAALKLIGKEGGILIYAWEEGRGTGIVNKIRAIALQETLGVSTAQAFRDLGHQPEPRSFEAHIAALRMIFGGTHIRFASDNPHKIAALKRAGYHVERVRLKIAMTPERAAYLAHKREHLGHLDDD